MAALGDQELLMILHDARKLLSDPSNWSHRHYAEDQTGRWIPVGSEFAVRFNLEGALVKSAGRDARDALPQLFELFTEISPSAIARLRSPSAPQLTHGEALSLLDEAMGRLSAPPVRTSSGVRPIPLPAGESAPRSSRTGRH